MKIVTLYADKLKYTDLPSKIEGSFWIVDSNNNKLINIEALDNAWYLLSNKENKIIEGQKYIESKKLENEQFYTFANNKNNYLIYTLSSYDTTMKLYQINDNADIVIGNNSEANIIYNNSYISPNYASLSYKNNGLILTISDNSVVYLNNDRVNKKITPIKNGDTIFIMGLSLTIINKMLIINNPNNQIRLNMSAISPVDIPIINQNDTEVNEEDYYDEEDYFFKTPRLRRFIKTYELTIAPPPSPFKEEEVPFILVAGPMLTMGSISIVSLANVITKLINKTATLANSWSSITIAFAMLLSILLWPNLTKRYRRKQLKKKEKGRVEKYNVYLKEKKRLLDLETINQRQILKENLLSLEECYDIIKNRKRTLWERKISQQDFLTVNIGIGDIPLDANINFSEDEFIIEEDPLKKTAEDMINEYKTLYRVPIGFSFYNKKVTAIMGIQDKITPFINNILLQLITYHSYDDLKLVVLTNEANENNWEYIKMLPHCFSNDKELRFFATNDEEYKKIGSYLEARLAKRIEQNQSSSDNVENEDGEESNTYLPYYLILTDDYLNIRKLGITEKILAEKNNYGFSFIVKESRLGKMPSECETFINIGSSSSTVLSTSINNSYQQSFQDEIRNNFDMQECAQILANIPIAFELDKRNLPSFLSFLDMYKIGKIEQLNAMNRWRINNPTKYLRAPIGVNDTNDIIYLDLHEKMHGPHGLIAGTTGSGKSEFIITYILSMAVNYSPNEVSFILIDYKGGGLAGAFENKKNNIKLPHLSGTITNLDKTELNRTLVSIDSELKRRQQSFNEARDELGESTMDIYKYQKLYRENKIKSPIPHLFIICDEFAELKSQQPEFMDNLISTARIGRSLGVHLILATQKPSGVVNDQIWSNSKFRVCLKVQDKADSNEMIKCPNAAELTNVGRFYLQVGYNEMLVLGQSGYSGSPYIPKDVVTQEIDRSIMFVDNTGDIIKQVDIADNSKQRVISQGDELSNILKYITNIATRENTFARRLWLDNIPKDIYIDELIKKYKFTPTNKITAIIGEYDDPSNQRQDLVAINLDTEGNTLVYGLSGVGREMFIKALIYSTCTSYKTEEINFYIFDFGSESLRIFSKLPHVGDICFSNENEKINKMLSMIEDEIQSRKKLFVDYNGDYETYCQNSGNKLPIYVVVINNYDALKESYSQYEELITKISRDGKRYGILMVITANSTTGMFSRLTRNFGNVYALDMNDKNDYINILGKIGNVYPSDFVGRGIFKKDLAYEFQTAKITEENKLVEFITTLSKKLSEANTYKAIKIPVLPEKITPNMVTSDNITIKNIPLGIDKEELNIYTYNFKKDKGTLIASNQIEDCLGIAKNITNMFKKTGNTISIALDAEEALNSIKNNFNNYYTTNFDETIKNIDNFIEQKIVNTQYEVVIMIIGLEKFKLNINTNDFNKFINKIKLIKNVTIIYIDSSFKIKKVAFESWYNEIINNANGIWIGNGIIDQINIKINDVSKKYKEQIDSNYAWIIKNASGTLIKLVTEEEENTDEE